MAPESTILRQSKETVALSSKTPTNGLDDSSQDARVQPDDSASHQEDTISENKQDPQKTPGQPVEVNVSITSDKIGEFQTDAAGVILYTDDELKEFRKNGSNYARSARLYINAIEARVSALESELHKVQIQIGVKKREGNLIQHALLDERCSQYLPCKAVRSSTRDMKKRKQENIQEEASIFLGFEANTAALDTGLARPSTHQGSRISSFSEEIGTRKPAELSVVSIQSEPTELARITFLSPWISIVLEVLTGQKVPTWKALVYPFKHLVAFEKQIRIFIGILSEVKLEGFQAKDLLGTLRHIFQQMPLDLDSTRNAHEYSDIILETMLLDCGDQFKGHFEKAKQALSKSREGPSSLEKQKNELTDSSHPLSPKSVGEGQDHGGASEPAEQSLPHLSCTCLKDAKDQLKLLINVIDEFMTPLLALQNSISERSLKKIKFRDLWMLYQPGDLVISSKTSKLPLQAYQVIHVCGGRPLMTKSSIYAPYRSLQSLRKNEKREFGISPFMIDCVYLDFDGETFGTVQTTIEISAFDDERQITELDVYPIDFSENPSALRDTLIKRGEHFATYRDFKHKRYSGLSLGDLKEEVSGTEAQLISVEVAKILDNSQIESEVMIDFEQAFREPEYHHHRPQLGIRGNSSADGRELYDDICSAKRCMLEDHNCILDDTKFDILRRDRFVNAASSEFLHKTHQSTENLSEVQLILLPYCVHGFSLRNRKWAALNIDTIKEIQDNKSLDGKDVGFDDLVIPDDYKKTVKALVKCHAIDSNDPNGHQVDLIRGKGKGLIILLHGVPGVGKTSTAESVAAFTGRPLFPITCGDIGQTAHQVEKKLEGIFLLARKWGCVLLLDEADVFLEKRERSGSSVERNALVSVFLRTLEYYSGILFLTTNRIGSFDEAFISRIHMSLYYADLDQESTLKVWMMNLNRIKRSGRNIYIDDEEIRAFARSHWRDGHRWNGRQIRNAFTTALALAEYDFHEKCKKLDKIGERRPRMPALLADQFKAVAQTSAEFDNYLSSVYGGSSHKLKAKEAELRSDDWRDHGEDTPTGKKQSAERTMRFNPPLERGDNSG